MSGVGALGAFLGGMGDGIQLRRNRDERAAQRAQNDRLMSIYEQQGAGMAIPMGAIPMGGGGAADSGQSAARAPMQSYRDAIASIESAGSGDYAAIGPTHSKLGRALGRYQIMEANIGPWSREVLGREVSAEEFMANPSLQDAIFDGKFGSYVKQYGPEGAAQAWFGGPGGVGQLGRKDSLGTTIAAYSDKFKTALGQTPVAAMPTAQPAPTVADIRNRVNRPMGATRPQ